MKIILDIGISKDGFIATKEGNSDWVSKKAEENFKERVKESGCLFVGRTTFKQFPDIYPIQGALNIVISSKSGEDNKNVAFALSPEEAIKVAEERGITRAILAGGAKTVAAFLDKDLVDEIFLTMHQNLELNEGIRGFTGTLKERAFSEIGNRELENGVIEEHYSK